MHHTMVKRVAAVLAAMTLLATAAACTGNTGDGEDATNKVTTTADDTDHAGNVWESLIEKLEGSETVFQRDEEGNIILPDIPIPTN